MPAGLGNFIVIAALAAIAVLAARSLWKAHRTAGRCTGDCTSCGSCHSGCSTKQ